MALTEEEHDQAVDVLAWIVTLTDGLVEPGERNRRAQVVSKMVSDGNDRALVMLSGLIAGMAEALPDDDGWKASGENRFGFTDVDLGLGLEGLPPLIVTLKVDDSLALASDARCLISLSHMGWAPVFYQMSLLPGDTRFETAENALRHALRRHFLYVRDDPRLWQFIAFLGAAREPDEQQFLKHVRPLRLPSGLYPAISVPAVDEPPF